MYFFFVDDVVTWINILITSEVKWNFKTIVLYEEFIHQLQRWFRCSLNDIKLSKEFQLQHWPGFFLYLVAGVFLFCFVLFFFVVFFVFFAVAFFYSYSKNFSVINLLHLNIYIIELHQEISLLKLHQKQS